MSGAAAAWVRRHPVLCFFVVFAIFPWVVPYKSLGSQVLIYGLFALGFNLLYGYTGLLSFGSAAYWGLGAYGPQGVQRVLEMMQAELVQAMQFVGAPDLKSLNRSTVLAKFK